MNPFTSFLVTVSGADRATLEVAQRDVVKQAALGGTLLMTAGLAGAAAALALSMALHVPLLPALAGGLVWAVMILNLDRWLVVSTPRQDHWLKTVMMALPRVGLAVVIGLVVSTPLTLQVFESEILTEIEVMQREAEDQFARDMAQDPRFARIPDMEAEVAALQTAIATGAPAGAVVDDPEVQALKARLEPIEVAFNAAEQEVACEKDGTCGSGTVGAGPAFNEKKDRRDRLAAERQALLETLATTEARVREESERAGELQSQADSERLEVLQGDLEDARSKRDTGIREHDASVSESTGLLARLEALQRLTQDNPTLHEAHLMLFLFLTILESLPILFKTMLSLGKPSLYDSLMMLADSTSHDRRRVDAHAAYETDVLAREAQLEAEQARAATQLDAELRAARIVVDAQVAITQEAVNVWREEQSDLIRDKARTSVVSTFPAGVPTQPTPGAIAGSMYGRPTDQWSTDPWHGVDPHPGTVGAQPHDETWASAGGWWSDDEVLPDPVPHPSAGSHDVAR